MKVIIICSLFLMTTSCHSDSRKTESTEVMKLADTITVSFYNSSLPPPSQFFSTLTIFKNGYVCRTEFGDDSLTPIEFKRPQDSLFWEEIRVFNPVNLKSQSQQDGETLSIQYKLQDSTYVHFPDVMSENEKKLLSLMSYK
jgi:hypothetical protein